MQILFIKSEPFYQRKNWVLLSQKNKCPKINWNDLKKMLVPFIKDVMREVPHRFIVLLINCPPFGVPQNCPFE